MTTIPANVRRSALEVLSRDSLAKITAQHELNVEDRRAVASHIDAIVRARSLDFGEVLRSLKRDELKAMCEALGLDDSGREKDLLVQRILGGEQPRDDGGKGDTGGFSLTPPEPKPRRQRENGGGAGGRNGGNGEAVGDYRHDATRKNNPPAGLIDFDRAPKQATKTYAYDPHLDPQLQWAGKAEHTSFEVDTVSLHIHERVSAQAIMRAVKREDAQRSLFAEDDLPESQAIDFYAHDVNWANRLILGDSLLVMSSLVQREQMAGKVQCIYVDPPYGVKFNSNFQPSISRREVKDGDDSSLTREPEQIQAYRDTWTLGVHSYLAYLRDRLLVARDLLAQTGSVFVQIADENVHHVRELMDEVFGRDNFVVTIVLKKKGATTPTDPVNDFILWYAKSRPDVKVRTLYQARSRPEDDPKFNTLIAPSGEFRRVKDLPTDEVERLIREGCDFARVNYPLVSQHPSATRSGDFTWNGKSFSCGHNAQWRFDPETDMRRLVECGRLFDGGGKSLGGVMRWSDWPYIAISNIWDDMHGDQEPMYVVQTNRRAVARCVLMTTDPGDLVLDPTCGSGTTAFVCEHWGRRWITCDTSRVALAIARQRLLTARYPFFRLRSDRVRDGFVYQTVPHVTLKGIAQNAKLDVCRTREERDRLIRECADQEPLYDAPEEVKGKVRVSGPFTVEAIPVASMEDPGISPTPGPEGELRDGNGEGYTAAPADPAGDHTAQMIDLLRKTGGVDFKGKRLPLPTLRPMRTAHEWIHAESETGIEGDARTIAVSFGPRHAPVTTKQVLDATRQARRYDMLLFVGFACDPEALSMIERGVPGCEMHFVHAAPDILVGDLLKSSRATKLFTVFGLPDVRTARAKDGKVTVTLTGVDIYDPLTGETAHDDGKNVAAWFLDHDYDGRTFCICQAFFPNQKAKNPWEKLQKALKGTIDEDRFEALRGTTSVPFTPGAKVAVKVVDDRGNEVVKIVDVQVPA